MTNGLAGEIRRPHKKVVFLHIPKTAGQSVHSFLERCFPREDISPTRVNHQLVGMPITEIRRYSLFSGHLDWALLDCVEGPKFVFTVLREPRDRILSFYFFLRRQAATFTAQDLELPQIQGMKAVLQLPCDEYFCGGPPHIRTFLDNHYDNFYTYYFASRVFDGRSRLISRRQTEKAFDDDRVVKAALDNLNLLDGLYTIENLAALERDLSAQVGAVCHDSPLSSIKVNVGSVNEEPRLEQLRRLGATWRTFNRLDQMVRLDEQIWHAAESANQAVD